MTPQERLLTAGLDDELDPAASLELQARLASDPSFRAAWEHQQQLRAAIRGQAAVHVAPERLRDQVLRAVQQDRPAARELRSPGADAPGGFSPPASRGGRTPSRRLWLAGAGVAALASLSTLAVVRLTDAAGLPFGDARGRRRLDDAVTGHARALLAERLVEVESSDQHAVKPWLTGRLSFSPTVPDLSAQGFNLVGARRDLLDGETCAVLIYRRQLHVISVFVVPASSDHPAGRRQVRGYHVVETAAGGMAYWIVSDLNAGELGDFAQWLVARS